MKGYTVVDANSDVYDQIAKKLQTTSEDIAKVCADIRKDIQNADSLMQDDSGKKACQSILDNMNEVLKLLPDMQDYAQKCKQISSEIIATKSIMKGI